MVDHQKLVEIENLKKKCLINAPGSRKREERHFCKKKNHNEPYISPDINSKSTFLSFLTTA